MKQILCFGDSNTWGLDGETGKRFPWEERWTGILQEKLADRDIRIVEEGLCGRTTIFEDPLRLGRRGTELLPTLLETHTPDAVVLMLGTNDCKTIFGASAEIIGKGIARLLEQINQYTDKMKVLVISPIYLGEKVWQDGYDQEFSPESVEVSKKLEPVYEKCPESMANDSCGQQIMRVRRKQIRSIWMDRVIRFLQMRFIEN